MNQMISIESSSAKVLRKWIYTVKKIKLQLRKFLKNDIRYDDTHMYLCVEDYTDGVAAIWKRINWASGNW